MKMKAKLVDSAQNRGGIGRYDDKPLFFCHYMEDESDFWEYDPKQAGVFEDENEALMAFAVSHFRVPFKDDQLYLVDASTLETIREVQINELQPMLDALQEREDKRKAQLAYVRKADRAALVVPALTLDKESDMVGA